MLNEKGFKELFNLHYKALCYHVRKIGLDPYEAEEVVQQVFIRFWELKDNLIIEKSFASYLYRAVRNQSLNHLKQKSIYSKNKDEYALKLKNAHLFVDLTEENGASSMIARELEKEISQAIDSLPQKCKEIFLLSRKESLSIKEIALRLDVSTNTVQKQISIAIARLRPLLKHYLFILLLIIVYFF